MAQLERTLSIVKPDAVAAGAKKATAMAPAASSTSSLRVMRTPFQRQPLATACNHDGPPT